jgi:Ni,Fe-hydrogenase I large subunit
MDKLEMIRVLLTEVVQFVNQVYFVDVCAVAAMYPEWFKIGKGVNNYLAVPDLPLDSAGIFLRSSRRLHHEREHRRRARLQDRSRQGFPRWRQRRCGPRLLSRRTSRSIPIRE